MLCIEGERELPEHPGDLHDRRIRHGRGNQGTGSGGGGVDYIRKPFNIEVALARIRTHLELKAHRDQLTRRVRDLHGDLERSEAEYLRLFEQQATGRKAGNDQ